MSNLSDAFEVMDELMAPRPEPDERLKPFQKPYAKGRRFKAGKWIEIHVEAADGTVFFGRFRMLDVNEFDDGIGIIARCELGVAKVPVFLRIGPLENQAQPRKVRR